MIHEGHQFMENLLREIEEKEVVSERAHFDLLLIEVKNLQNEIAKNFEQADKEVKLIQEWALQKNSKLQDKVERIERLLEAFIRASGEKTIDLPNGILKLHKKPDKIEIENLELFLQHARMEMLSRVPETYKPDMAKIKQYCASHMNPPKGVKVTKGQPEFTYKLKEGDHDAERTEEEAGSAIESAGTD
ncbi:MAG: host-nuclease inhibitor Gam family protein [Bacteroidetes bacterium]|nr:host-nuclease inhibitor Gam family protein [Bacteroidota bacterium]